MICDPHWEPDDDPQAPVPLHKNGPPVMYTDDIYIYRPQYGKDVKKTKITASMSEQESRIISEFVEACKVWGTKGDYLVWAAQMMMPDAERLLRTDENVGMMLQQTRLVWRAWQRANLATNVTKSGHLLRDGIIDALQYGYLDSAYRQISEHWGEIAKWAPDEDQERFKQAVLGSALLKAACRLLIAAGKALGKELEDWAV